MLKNKRFFWKDWCGCCWHFHFVKDTFGFGRKDGFYYLLLFSKTYWLYKLKNGD